MFRTQVCACWFELLLAAQRPRRVLLVLRAGRVTLKLTHSAPGLPYYFWNVTYNVQPASGRKLV